MHSYGLFLHATIAIMVHHLMMKMFVSTSARKLANRLPLQRSLWERRRLQDNQTQAETTALLSILPCAQEVEVLERRRQKKLRAGLGVPCSHKYIDQREYIERHDSGLATSSIPGRRNPHLPSGAPVEATNRSPEFPEL